MRILFFAKDAPMVNSGYGKCVREISLRLKHFGHEVAVFATVGNKASPIFEWNGLRIYPGTDDIFGEDIVLSHLKHWEADLLLTQVDIWPFRKLPEYAANRQCVWIPYVPLDSFPINNFFIERLKSAYHIVTMCRWAEDQLRSTQFSNVSTIHHGVDTSKYFPYDEADRREIKYRFGFSKDAYVIGMVQANQIYRKAWEEQLRAVKAFSERHRDVRLLIHTIPVLSDSYNIPELMQDLGLEKISRTAEPYKLVIGYDEKDMADLYNGCDVLLSATNGEGFGLPVIEAQACGTPVVATNCMSFPELVKFGALAEVRDWFRVPNMIRKAIPSVSSIEEKLEAVRMTTWNRETIANEAKRTWDWERVIIPQWINLLDTIEKKLDADCMEVPPLSEALKRTSQEEIIVG